MLVVEVKLFNLLHYPGVNWTKINQKASEKIAGILIRKCTKVTKGNELDKMVWIGFTKDDGVRGIGINNIMFVLF